MVDPDEPRPRRNTHAGVNVVASDDGTGYPYGGADGARDVYGSSYPGKKSRHDVEQKTGDRDRRFREKRGTYETDEAEKLRRAKSYSPRRAAREAEAPRRVSPQAPKSTWPEDEYAGAGPHHHRSSKKSHKGGKGGAAQYYDDDPYASYYASQAQAQAQAPPPRSSKKTDRGGNAAAYDYAPGAEDMPRPPMGEHAPYKSSPLSSYPEADEKPSKHHRKRDKNPYGASDPYGGATGYEDYAAPKAGTSYDRAGYGAAAAASAVPEEAPPPRRSRHSKHHDDRGAAAGVDEYGYPAQPPPQPRGRHRAPPSGGDYGEADSYDRAPPPRPRHRQSMPPQPRSQYPDDPYDNDPYGQSAAPPRRRATSVNYGRQQQDRYGGGGDPRRDQYYDDGYGRGGGSPSGSGGSGGYAGGGAGAAGGKKGNKKSKAYAQQAGKLFMTHAVPVIKKEAVPFLTKAAQAYFEQQKR